MPLPVSLGEVADTLAMQSDELRVFLNRRTGELLVLSDEELRLPDARADDGEPDGREPDVQDWEARARATAERVRSSDDFLPLPSRWEIHDYGIMERFCYAVDDERQHERLVEAIRGRGAFRSFREAADRAGLLEAWYAYRSAALAEIAADWLDEHGVAYERGAGRGRGG